MAAPSREEKLRFLKALEEDAEFRYAVAGLIGLGEVLSELKRLREDFQRHVELEEKRWEENRRLWEENSRRWEEAYKRFEAIESELRRLREDFNKAYERFDRRLAALGARWGIEAEEAFREAMRGVVEEILGAGKVEKWVYYDEGGEVLGYPARIEVDVLVRDSTHVLIEVKSSASEGDVAKLWRIGKLYARVKGVKPRLALVTPFISEEGLEAARKLGVEVYTRT